jgi:hypothetical protein
VRQLSPHTDSKKKFRFTSVLERSSNRLWGCHFRVPGRIAESLVDGKSRRVVCTLNDAAEYQSALRPIGGGVFVIPVNKTLRDSLGITFGMEVQATLKRDSSEYGLPMPEEFLAVLRQDPEGDRLFHGLTRGRQRTLLHIVGSEKSREKRIVRAVTVLHHLKVNNGRINFRQLYESLRDPRR